MSCSDKLASWNVTGLQGSLLSNILREPVYLTSCIIGQDTYNYEALVRALSARIRERVRSLPSGYRANAPRVLSTAVRFSASREDVEARIIQQSQAESVSSSKTNKNRGNDGNSSRTACNPCGSSLNWSAASTLVWESVASLHDGSAVGHSNVAGDVRGARSAPASQARQRGGVYEATIGGSGLKLGTTKKTEGTDASVSRLAKKNMFRSFLRTVSALDKEESGSAKWSNMSYDQAKRANGLYGERLRCVIP
jgi:hypothetical protein